MKRYIFFYSNSIPSDKAKTTETVKKNCQGLTSLSIPDASMGIRTSTSEFWRDIVFGVGRGIYEAQRIFRPVKCYNDGYTSLYIWRDP